MDSQIVIINGLGGSGKSTFISLCKKYVESLPNIGEVYELSTIDYVKKVASFCGWNGRKETKDRIFLHELKAALEKWDNIPENKVFEEINELENTATKGNIYFVNIREKYNIESFTKTASKNGFKCTTVIVVNNQNKSNEAPEIISDIVNYKYDKTIYNDSDFVCLFRNAKNFVNNLIKENKMNKTVVIAAFPCCGKSTASESLKDFYTFSDSDSSNFSWLDKENGIRNPDFPANYINHIKELIGKKDVIFVSTHKVVREALEKAEIPYYLVYPENTVTNKNIWAKRMLERGNDESFISNILSNWDDMIDDMSCEMFPVHYILGKDGNRDIIDANSLEDILALAF